MSSRRSKIGQHKHALARSEKHLATLTNKQAKLRRILQNLNAQHEAGRISYSEYSQLFDKYLGHRSVEEWERYYATEISRIQDRVDYYKGKLADRAERKSAVTRTIAATIAIMAMMAAIAGLASLAGFEPAAQITGFAAAPDETSAYTANATIEVYFAMARSADLASGLQFGVLDHNTQDNNATKNYNATDKTDYFIAISGDSNVNVDMCTKADSNFEGPNAWADALSANSLSIANSTTNSASQPALTDEIAYSTSVTKMIGANIAPGADNYLRFWMDMPFGQPAGAYNTSVTFMAVQTGASCSIS